MPVRHYQGVDLTAGVVLETGGQRAGDRADRGDVLGRCPAHRGEVPAEVGGGAVAAVEGDGVDRAADVGVPRGDRVRGRVAEAERVVPGECLDRAPVPSADLGERAYRVHDPAAVHQLA